MLPLAGFLHLVVVPPLVFATSPKPARINLCLGKIAVESLGIDLQCVMGSFSSAFAGSLAFVKVSSAWRFSESREDVCVCVGWGYFYPSHAHRHFS